MPAFWIHNLQQNHKLIIHIEQHTMVLNSASGAKHEGSFGFVHAVTYEELGKIVTRLDLNLLKEG